MTLQSHFRFRSDAGAADASPTWGAAEDASSFNPGTSPFRVRVSLANRDAAATLNHELRVSKNGGAYTAVTTSSTNGVKSTDAGSDADGTAIKVPRLSQPLVPMADGVLASIYADFIHDNRYWFNGNFYLTVAAWTAAMSGAFSRASSAYYTDATGKLVLATTDELRFDHDVNGNPLGILLEGSVENIAQYSQQFDNAFWSLDPGATITADTTVAPDGNTTADTYRSNRGSPGNCEFYHLFTTGIGVATAISIYAKPINSNFIGLCLQGTTTQNFVTQIFDISMGVLGESKLGTTSGTLISASIEPAANGFYRCKLVASTGNNGNYAVFTNATLATGNTFNGNGDVSLPSSTDISIAVWQADVVLASFISSPILTTGASATRSADKLELVPGAGVLNAAAGTVLTKLDRTVADTGGSQAIVIQEATVGSEDAWTPGGTGNQIVMNVDGGANLLPTPQQTGLGPYVDVMTWSAAGQRISGDGGTVQVDGTSISSAAYTRIQFDGDPARPWFGHMKKYGYWPFLASDPELVRLSGAA